MGRWNDAQRESRKARTEALRIRVLAGIMAANGLRGQAPRCLNPGCGEADGLVVDHPLGRTWDVRKPNSEVRWRIYEKELNSSPPVQLGILCAHHSGKDGRMRFQARPKWRLLDALTAPVPNALTAQERRDLQEYLYGPLWIWDEVA